MYVWLGCLILLTQGCFPAHGWLRNSCKCGPDDKCWPSASRWKALNSSVGGKLIEDSPVAISCYPGPAFSVERCAQISTQLKDQSFVSNNPIALSYPTESCPPLNLSADPCSIGYSNSKPCTIDNGSKPPQKGCTIGDQPRYTINASTVHDVIAGVNFARDNNIRLVVRDTGHDILRRSTGYGSLQIWVRYLRSGVKFLEHYQPSRMCSKSSWAGPAFYVGGGYTWSDVYPEAVRNNVVVVGGGTPTVGCLGGWMQGGGHGPATHDYGLGADQVLEAQVVLASGKLITASPCSYPDIFFAIRGGGPSTYGVVISTVVKAHPNVPVAAQVLGFAPLAPSNVPQFFEALAAIYSSYPSLSDAGFSGYGSWSLYSPTPLIPKTKYSTAFIHTVAVLNKSVADAERIFAPVAAKLKSFNGTSLFMTTTYLSFPTYGAYYSILSNISSPIGSSSAALGSRLLDRNALTGDTAALKHMLNVTAGVPEQAVSNNIVFVGGGQVARDASDPYSGVNPAWRKAYVHNIVARGWAAGSDDKTIQSIRDDVTYNKVGAMRQLAPQSGAYMNEGDRNDPQYLEDFYGANRGRLEGIKRRYDPQGVFFCKTCIGSDGWREDEKGVLCRVQQRGKGEQEEHGDGREGHDEKGHAWPHSS